MSESNIFPLVVVGKKEMRRRAEVAAVWCAENIAALHPTELYFEGGRKQRRVTALTTGIYDFFLSDIPLSESPIFQKRKAQKLASYCANTLFRFAPPEIRVHLGMLSEALHEEMSAAKDISAQDNAADVPLAVVIPIGQ